MMIKDDNYFRNALNRINEVLPIRAGLHNKITDVPCDVGQYAIEMAKLRALQAALPSGDDCLLAPVDDDCIAQQIAELEGHAYLDDEDLIAAQEQITDASNIAYEIGRQADGMIMKERGWRGHIDDIRQSTSHPEDLWFAHGGPAYMMKKQAAEVAVALEWPTVNEEEMVREIMRLEEAIGDFLMEYDEDTRNEAEAAGRLFQKAWQDRALKDDLIRLQNEKTVDVVRAKPVKAMDKAEARQADLKAILDKHAVAYEFSAVRDAAGTDQTFAEELKSAMDFDDQALADVVSTGTTDQAAAKKLKRDLVSLRL